MSFHSASERAWPLKARLTWRTIQNNDSLLSHIVSAKYRDILGKNNNRDKSFNEWPITADCLGLEGLKLNYFIDSNGSWKIEYLRCYFNEDLIAVILQIKIESDATKDFLEKIYSLSGKSITARAFEAHCNSQLCEKDSGFTAWLKKLKLTARVELFWWRMSRGAIPTNEFLKYRKHSDDDHCPRGCGGSENVSHIAVKCKHLQEVLRKIQDWGLFVPIFESLEDCLRDLKGLSVSAPNIVIKYCNVIYWNWKNRNEVAHGKETITVLVTTTNVISTAFLSVNPLIASWGANLPREFQIVWHPPPLGWIKINVDAVLLPSYVAGIGGCFRDDKGRLLVAFGENKVHWDIDDLELEAVMSVRKYLQPWMIECKGLIMNVITSTLSNSFKIL
ncbi:uncharacterized protein LOC110111227 [Dendrobium catenatum]|uniref:uncharacterized protein LOC110111227 n=1 Tax=Dendrobium catenatum TaxID=906689 RepID=UPI0010A05DF8|nr:uncharacterized protein LOC110111227 [Dendrobium catenatum]